MLGPCQKSKKASRIRLVGLQEHGRPISFCHCHHRSINQVHQLHTRSLQQRALRARIRISSPSLASGRPNAAKNTTHHLRGNHPMITLLSTQSCSAHVVAVGPSTPARAPPERGPANPVSNCTSPLFEKLQGQELRGNSVLLLPISTHLPSIQGMTSTQPP